MLGKEYEFKIGIIKKIREETYNVSTFHIEVEGLNGEVKPGQFNILYLFGGGEVPISISEIGRRRLAHTVRFTGTITNMFRELTVNDKIGVRGPYGNHWPIEEHQNEDILIIGGGIGIAPLKPIIQYVKEKRSKYGKLIILYGARTPKDLIFKSEFEEFRKIRDSELHLTVDRGDEKWKGNIGVVTTLIPPLKLNIENTVAFVCGPEIMMYYTVKDLAKKGIPETKIYISLERRMRCGIGLCGHCQIGPYFVCKDGPVFPYWKIKEYFGVKWI
ncbi:MAG: FAD/NAD(P)-binding protein [archaeon GB-1845-036]|nr:FAD/NAD(P)-binding protein [Candidatus Culexmicrobium thermophilum]